MTRTLLFKIAWRNLWRHPRRTVLTALGLGLGLALLLVSIGLGDGSHKQMIDNGVKLGGGHVVVQAQGYQDTRSQDLLLPAWVVSTIEETLQAQDRAAVQGVNPRLMASGLLSSAVNAAGVGIVGVRPEAEQATSLVPQRIVEGSYVGNRQSSGLVIGAELAEKLEVQVGSKVVLMAQAVRSPEPVSGDGAGGEIQSALFRVAGIFHTGLREIDAYVVHLPLATMQKVLGAADHVTQVAIFLRQEEDSSLVARHLRNQLARNQVEVLTWREAMAELAQFVWLDDAFNYVVNGIILVMVGLGLLNTMLMAVLERRYEFGVCTALGLQPGQLLGLVLCESWVLTVISLAVGLVLGLGVHSYFAAVGLDLRSIAEMDFPIAGTVFDPILYSHLSLERIVWSVGVVWAMAAVLSLYPAWKAARTELPAALRVL